jgi:3-dehydroquinate synthase
LKTLWIRGKKFSPVSLFDFVHCSSISPALGKLIKECLAFKAQVVERDPLDERRIREVLNFGHTVGHALESVSKRPHGECVLWGMAVETRLLGRSGAVMEKVVGEAIQALALRPPKEFLSLTSEQWLALLSADKKTKGGRIELSLLSSPGRIVRKRVEPIEVTNAIRRYLS